VSVTPFKASRNGRRGSTSTANFGSGRREGHDASAFYARFVAPEISTDCTINRPDVVDVIYSHDARDMAKVASNSVALVVTSPPYFAGKQYEESLGVDGVPGTYFEYLELLHDVFSECKRVLEPGGRIAVNVANLGRRPYRSLAADVTEILQDLGLLLPAEALVLNEIPARAGEPDLILAIARIVVADVREDHLSPHLTPLHQAVAQSMRRIELFGSAKDVDVGHGRRRLRNHGLERGQQNKKKTTEKTHTRTAKLKLFSVCLHGSGCR